MSRASSSLVATAADILLKTPDVIIGRIKTASAMARSDLGDGCRVMHDGTILNMRGEKDAVRIGAKGSIRGELFTFPHAGRIEIGDHFYCGPRSMIWSSDSTGIRIGHRVLIASGALVFDTNTHPIDATARFEQTRAIMERGHPPDITTIASAPVTIGDDVWIASCSIVLKGVTIGDRAVIGAGSVICTDVAADSLIPAGTVLKKDK